MQNAVPQITCIQTKLSSTVNTLEDSPWHPFLSVFRGGLRGLAGGLGSTQVMSKGEAWEFTTSLISGSLAQYFWMGEGPEHRLPQDSRPWED